MTTIQQAELKARRREELKGRKVLILGAARSGMAAARALSSLGAIVRVSEPAPDEKKKQSAASLERIGVEVDFGEQSPRIIADSEMIVPSPGISPKTAILSEAIKSGLTVLSEIEIAWLITEAPVIAVTGTNGKTTTASLIAKIIGESPYKSVVAGNIGLAMSEAVLNNKGADFIVAEVSSFQLEFIRDFRPHVAVLLNITPDHFDWHGNIESYVTAKSKLLKNQTSEDFAVINEVVPASYLPNIAAEKIYFGLNKRSSNVFVENGRIIAEIGGKRDDIGGTDEIVMAGEHNVENCLAAVAAALVIGIKASDIMPALRSFTGVEHRLEPVREIDGIRFFNDSKATNPEAAIKGILSFEEPVILIAGGRNKDNSFRELAASASGRVKKAILIGEAAGDIARVFEEKGIGYYTAETMRDAVIGAKANANAGDIVLLSPACASYDMFENFEDRGRAFKQAVGEL